MFYVQRANNIRHLDDAARLRYIVFSEILHCRKYANDLKRELGAYDAMERTTVVNVYHKEEAVGTLRIVDPGLPTDESASNDWVLPLESMVRFTYLEPNARVGELGRIAIHPAYRATEVVRLLFREMHLICREKGITHYAGLTISGERTIEGAEAMTSSLVRAGYGSSDVSFEAISRTQAVAAAEQRWDRSPCRPSTEWLGNPQISGLPSRVRFFLKVGMRIAGGPVRDEAIDMMMLPMVGLVSDLPKIKFGRKTIWSSVMREADPITIYHIDAEARAFDAIPKLEAELGRAIKVVWIGGKDAYERSTHGATPDLVITELQLPWATGFELYRQRGEANWTCSWIMLTNVGDEIAAVDAMKHGFHDYISLENVFEIHLANAMRTAFTGDKSPPSE